MCVCENEILPDIRMKTDKTFFFALSLQNDPVWPLCLVSFVSFLISFKGKSLNLCTKTRETR